MRDGYDRNVRLLESAHSHMVEVVEAVRRGLLHAEATCSHDGLARQWPRLIEIHAPRHRHGGGRAFRSSAGAPIALIRAARVDAEHHDH